jgi:HD-GYP domain-containing protein (c-di-GMP phosphodiesterase class II)
MLSVDIDLANAARDRDEIVWRIVSTGVLPEQRTLAVGIVAEAFFDRFLIALDRGSYLDLLTWIDRTCETYASAPQIGSMLAGAARAIASTLGERGALSPAVSAGIVSLEQSIGPIAFRSRRREPKNGIAHVDEAGRLIHELLLQMEATDPLTLEHSHAVSLWCSRIARRLALSENEVAHVGRCGLVHDFGKMNVPAEILHAPRKLTAQEWGIVQMHPAMGEELVNTMKPLRPFAATVRSHHERLDGKGYPDGLVSSQITLTTRIVTVADAFNAMIGRRPYRLPMSPGNALDQLHACRGTQFDPIVVEAMVDVVQRAEDR